MFVGLAFLATAYLGGITSASGAFVAGAIGTLGIVFVIFDRNLNLGKYYALFSGLSLILTVVLNPRRDRRQDACRLGRAQGAEAARSATPKRQRRLRPSRHAEQPEDERVADRPAVARRVAPHDRRHAAARPARSA